MNNNVFKSWKIKAFKGPKLCIALFVYFAACAKLFSALRATREVPLISNVQIEFECAGI